MQTYVRGSHQWLVLTPISALIFLLLIEPARPQDPQTVLNGLIQQQLQQQTERHKNEMMRLQIERDSLERQLRYPQASDQQIMEELMRYCPTGEPPCPVPPPQSLINEALRRGLVTLLEPRPRPARNPPAIDCVTLGDGEGGGITNCE